MPNSPHETSNARPAGNNTRSTNRPLGVAGASLIGSRCHRGRSISAKLRVIKNQSISTSAEVCVIREIAGHQSAPSNPEDLHRAEMFLYHG
jgi:hypothetical protein